jgi:acyl carrier protein
MDRVETGLLRFIKARLWVTPAMSTKLTDLNLDSIKTADFFRELEVEFDVRFDRDVFGPDTVADPAAYVRERVTETSRSE